MSRIQIVKRGSKEPVGTLEVDAGGPMRVVDGPADLQEAVRKHLSEGLWSVRSFITVNGDQIAEPYIMTPDQPWFEHALSTMLGPLGYCTAGMADVLEGPVRT